MAFQPPARQTRRGGKGAFLKLIPRLPKRISKPRHLHLFVLLRANVNNPTAASAVSDGCRRKGSATERGVSSFCPAPSPRSPALRLRNPAPPNPAPAFARTRATVCRTLSGGRIHALIYRENVILYPMRGKGPDLCRSRPPENTPD